MTRREFHPLQAEETARAFLAERVARGKDFVQIKSVPFDVDLVRNPQGHEGIAPLAGPKSSPNHGCVRR